MAAGAAGQAGQGRARAAGPVGAAGVERAAGAAGPLAASLHISTRQLKKEALALSPDGTAGGSCSSASLGTAAAGRGPENKHSGGKEWSVPSLGSAESQESAGAGAGADPEASAAPAHLQPRPPPPTSGKDKPAVRRELLMQLQQEELRLETDASVSVT